MALPRPPTRTGCSVPKLPPKPSPAVRLSRDIYETLHLHALAFGGIGGGSYQDHKGLPLCAIGMLRAADRAPFEDKETVHAADVMLVRAWGAGVTPGENDAAVERANLAKGKKGRARHDRVPFEEWCAAIEATPVD